MKDSLTPKELARILGRSQSTLHSWRENKTGPPFIRSRGDSGRFYYPKDKLAEWLMDQEI